MKNQYALTDVIRAAGSIFLLGVSMSANAGLFGFGGTSWKEEVLLHDGSKMVVERSQSRGGRHEITSGPPIKEQSINFVVPGTTKLIAWRDEYNDEVGSANFQLLALHILNGDSYLIATPYGCLAYNKWGRPNPPYVIYKYVGELWQRIQLQELPTEFKNINLIISTNEKELNGVGMAFAERIVEMNGSPRQPEYRTILREPVKGGEGSLVNCPDYSSPRYMSPKAPNPM